MNRRSSWTCIETSSSVRSGRPLARRRAFCASSIWSTSSSSSSASTSGERVGFQSSTSAPDTGWYFPIAAKIRNRMRMNPRKNAPSTPRDSTYDERVPEGRITEEDLARMRRGFELYNQGDYDGLRDLISPDVVMERVGDQEPVRGWEAFRAFQDPDAFEWQHLEPLEWSVNGEKVLVRLRIHAKGAGSGVELDTPGWMVWTIRNGLGVHVLNTTDEKRALEEFRAPPGF